MNIGAWSNLLKENSINNNKILGNSLEKLSTGLKINKAADDASGLAISDKLRTQATGIKQGIDNANSAIAMMNIADKSIAELSSILDTIKAKAIQMNTDTTSEEGRKIIKTDILKLIENYDDIVCRTNYNQTPLLNGCATPFDFQVGEYSADIVRVDIDNIESRQMGQADPFKLKNFITGFNAMPVELPPTTVISPEEAGLAGQSGVVRVNFSWNVDIDIDPVVIDPNGDAMGFNASWAEGDINGDTHSTISGGNWDVDDTGGTGTNQENFYWAISAPVGDYNFYIRNYETPATFPIDIQVTIKTGNNIEVRNLAIPSGEKDIGPFTFNYDGSLNNIPTTPTSPIETCACDSLNLIRNDDSPTLLHQAIKLMEVVDEALTQLNSQRSNVGAGINQLEVSAKNMMTSYVNVKSAESVIRDLDYASESANFNKANIISQAGSFVQSQANNIDKQYVSQLLK
ncbi:MAG: flagellin [Arcobacter sp.]|uniref:flagellin N-terminal helical domain-containing protein n=1 Tax=Arcobacter sp. TaxID=1872629 RepID=UPI00258D3AF5|nr:flagellin [Arcobacter sp.]MDD3007617.1 flagellin [Arcobacter sp.]